MREWIMLVEGTMYPSPDNADVHSIGYWLKPSTGEAVPVTWGYDEGNDAGHHHLDVAMQTPDRFLTKDDQQALQQMADDGGYCTDNLIDLMMTNGMGWTRVHVSKWPNEPMKASMDAPDRRTARAAMRWLMNEHPEIHSGVLSIWEGDRPVYYNISDDALEAFVAKGHLRKDRALNENAKGPTSLIDVANHFLFIHDDLLDDDEGIEDMDEKMALEIIRREYVSGTCGAFAVALHDKLGYPIIGINGGMHIAVQAPDGDVIDFMGKNPLKKVMRRYGMSNAPVEQWSREEAVEHVLMDEETDNPWQEIQIAKWVMNHFGRW